MGRGENNLLYGDALRDFDFFQEENIKYDPAVLKFGHDFLSLKIESAGLKNNPEEDYNTKDIMSPTRVSSNNEKVFLGSKYNFNVTKRNTLNNSKILSGYSGNKRLLLNSRTIPDGLLNKAIVENPHNIGHINNFTNKGEAYDLLMGIHDIGNRNKSGVHVENSEDIDIVEIKDIENGETYRDFLNYRKRGVAVSLTAAKTKESLWVFASELSFIESFPYESDNTDNSNVDAINKLEQLNGWQAVSLIGSKRITSSQGTYLVYFKEGKVCGIIKPCENPSKLLYDIFL